MGTKKHHIGFKRLEEKIERTERKEHPNYSSERIQYIGKATAAKVYHEQINNANHPILAPLYGQKKHHCMMCGITH